MSACHICLRIVCFELFPKYFATRPCPIISLKSSKLKSNIKMKSKNYSVYCPFLTKSGRTIERFRQCVCSWEVYIYNDVSEEGVAYSLKKTARK